MLRTFFRSQLNMLHASSPSRVRSLVADLTSAGSLHCERRGVSCTRFQARRKRVTLLKAQSEKKGGDDPYAKVSEFGSKLASSQEAQFLAAMQDATQDELRQQREAAAQQDQRKWQQLQDQKQQRQQRMNQSDAQDSKQAETRPDADLLRDDPMRTSDANGALPLSDADTSQIDEDARQRRRKAGGSGYTDQAAGMVF